MKKTNPVQRILTATAGLAVGLFAHASVLAQAAWPDKPIVLVVPYSAGGPTDVVARLLAVPMGKSLGQTVIVENTVGAGGTLAAARVARAAPLAPITSSRAAGICTQEGIASRITAATWEISSRRCAGNSKPPRVITP